MNNSVNNQDNTLRGFLPRLKKPEKSEPLKREILLFSFLAVLGVITSYTAMNIPNTELFFDVRFVFGFLGFALLRHTGSALLLAGILGAVGFHPIPLYLCFLGNMLYAVPELAVIRAANYYLLARMRHPAKYTIAWFLLALFCYQGFHTPILGALLALLNHAPVMPAILNSWKEQLFLVEGLIVASMSAAGYLAIRSHEALYRRSTELAITLDSIGDGVIVTDAGGMLKRMNPIAQDLTGWSSDEALGQPLETVFHIVNAKTGEPAENPVTRVLQEGIIVGMANDTVLITKDGRERMIADSAAPIRDVDGLLIGTVMVFRDMTERYEALETLRQSKEQLDLALHAAVMGVWDWEINTGSVKWGGEHAALFGIPIEKFGGSIDDVQACIHPDDREMGMEVFQKTVETGAPFDNTYRVVWPDETIHWMHSHGKLTYDDEGNPHRIIGATQDITAQIRYEEELRDREERLRAILESNPNPIVVYDKKGHPIYINHPFTATFGWILEELKGRTIPFVPEDQKEITAQKIKELFQKQSVVKFRTKRLTQNGDILELIVSAAHIKGHEETPAGMVVNLIDITEQIKLEESLRQSQKMESIGNLAGGIAHDFNNILFPIIGYTEILKADNSIYAEGKKYIDEIMKAALRAKELVKQILAFGRQAENQMAPVRVQYIIKEVLKLIRSTIPANIEIIEDIRKDCGSVLADPTQIHQILMNLITNAYHAVDEAGGRISVELKEIHLNQDELFGNLRHAGQYDMLSVSDTGCGIDPAIKDKIFEPYFTTKEKGKGTGLGLAVVFGIVRKHKGDIQVYSEKGQGTTFNVYLPLIESSSEARAKEESDVDLTGGERILLVDDDKIVAQLEKQMLARLGYEVTECTSSVEALSKFKTNPDGFDLVITDMTMPNLTGDFLAAEMLAARPDTPIILCTGFSEKINEEKAKALGIKGFLMKPVVKSELARMVRNVLGQSKNDKGSHKK